MKKIIVGIDISKEKLNVCLLEGINIVHEDEIENTVASLHKWFGRMRKSLKCCMDEVLLCAEFTGRYIYPLAVACQEEEAFLWMEDPSRIKNSFGLVRGKSDSVDARRIAEYAFRHHDKAIAYHLPSKELASIKILIGARPYFVLQRLDFQIVV